MAGLMLENRKTCFVLVQLVTSATGNQQVNSNDLNSLIQGVRLTQAGP